MARGAIVGASTLLGRELADELATASAPAWDLVLLDDDADGRVTAAGDEAMVVQPVTPEALEGADVVFFTGDAGSAGRHATAAEAAGASLVDLTGGLRGRTGMQLRSVWTGGGTAPNLASVGVVSPNAATLMLAVLAERVQNAAAGPGRLIATVLRPASEQGSAGLDELHKQTVSLLSFQAVPREVYDAQVAFSLHVALGPEAKLNLQAERQRIVDDFRATCGAADAIALAVQLVQAPVFHGYTASVWIEAAGGLDADRLRNALDGGVLQLAADAEAEPSNEAVAAQSRVLLRMDGERDGAGGGVWVWMAADNLRLLAAHGAACAQELLSLRPRGGLQ